MTPLAEYEMQNPLPGFEDYVCTFQCLTHCPFPDECIWDDPLIGMFDQIVYPEFFELQLEHLTETQEKELMEEGSDLMIITPDCLDQFYPEPPGDVYRCPRCHSTDIIFGESWIVCGHCEYNEELFDFPDNLTKRDDLEEIIGKIRKGGDKESTTVS